MRLPQICFLHLTPLISCALVVAFNQATHALPNPPKTGTPPERSTPGSNRPGSDRSCPSTPLPVIPLTRPEKNFTLAERPTVWFYLPYPKTEVKTLKFSLQDANFTQTLYQTTLTTPTTAGIMAVPTQPDPPMKLGENYRWQVIVECRAKQEGVDTPIEKIEGWVQRIEPSSSFARQLQSTSNQARVKLYLENHGWYDALTYLANLRLKNPQDANLRQQWSQLLQVAGRDHLIDQPFAKP